MSNHLILLLLLVVVFGLEVKIIFRRVSAK